MLNSKKMIPSLSGMISPNLIDKITTLLFDDINNADDGTLIVYFVAEAMREIYKPYSEKLDEDDIPNRNLYFDFCNNELVVRCVDEKSGSSSAEFVSGSVLISTPQTNVELLNNSFKLTAEQICNKYRDSKPESEWDESFKRIYASNFRRFLSGLGNEFYDLFEVNLNKTVLNYLSGLKILLEDYASKSINNGVEYRGTNLLDYYLNFIVDNKEIDNSLYRFFEKSCDNENYYVTLNPEVIGIDFVLKKIHSDSKVFEKFNTFYMKGYISFLLKNICSLEELITAVPISEGQQLLFALAHLDDNSKKTKFINFSKPKDVEFYLKNVRNLLFGIKDINLEELALIKPDDYSEETRLSVLLNNMSIAIGGHFSSNINKEIIKNLFIDDPLSKNDIDQLAKSLSKIQLLIWQNKVISPEIVSEKYKLFIFNLCSFLNFSKETEGIDKEVHNHFISKFFGSVDRKYDKDLNDSFRTIIHKLILDTDLDEIPVSLKLLSNLSSVTRTKNLLISDTFIPMNKKIVLYDLPGLYFDENLMIALSKIETYFNIDQSNSNICFDKNEEKSWNLLFDCIDSGHLDFNLYVEEAKSNLIYLKNEQTK